MTTSNFISTMPADHSGLIVYMFLGFCALIVTMQLVPSIVMMYTMTKAAVMDKKIITISSTFHQ